MDAKQVIINLDPWLQQMWTPPMCTQWEQNQICTRENRIQTKNRTHEMHCVVKTDLQRIVVL